MLLLGVKPRPWYLFSVVVLLSWGSNVGKAAPAGEASAGHSCQITQRQVEQTSSCPGCLVRLWPGMDSLQQLEGEGTDALAAGAGKCPAFRLRTSGLRDCFKYRACLSKSPRVPSSKYFAPLIF